MVTKFKRNVLLLPKINEDLKISSKKIIPELPPKYPIKLSNPTNLTNLTNQTNNIKLNPIKKNRFKPRAQCIDTEEYLQQFHHIPEIYNINEFNSKLIYLKKILLGKNIYLLKTGWECVWDDTIYSIDKAEEMICKRYPDVIEERYKLLNIKYNLNKYNYPTKLMCLLYTKELISFIYLSDYSIYSGKISGIIKMNINYINNDEKNIILSCVRETFLDRYKYDEITMTLSIQLKRK